ncbi:30S ribosomal protein THX [Runella sp.]
MGKGDKKSKKGKIWRGSYGVLRPSKKKKNATVKKTRPKAEA